MINFVTGDLLKSDADALVNAVNCVGVMGKGIALQFREAFPANFKSYKAACQRSEVKPGAMFVSETGISRPRYIINFPTKLHWKDPSRIEYIQTGLQALGQEIESRGIRSIALPALGAGLGGLDWQEVKQEIISALNNLNADITIYEPHAK